MIEKDEDGNQKIFYGTWRNGVKHGLFDIQVGDIFKRNCVYQNNVCVLDGKIVDKE